MIKVNFRFDTDDRNVRRVVYVMADFFMDARRIVANTFPPVHIYGCERE